MLRVSGGGGQGHSQASGQGGVGDDVSSEGLVTIEPARSAQCRIIHLGVPPLGTFRPPWNHPWVPPGPPGTTPGSPPDHPGTTPGCPPPQGPQLGKTDLPDDVGRLQFGDGFDVLGDGAVVVALVIQVVAVLSEDVDHAVLVVLLGLRQAVRVSQ